MATQITIQRLHKEFRRDRRRTVAVEQVDLVVEPGEIFFLLGPSGCGKTTLLRMIAGFIEPTKGRILFDESDVTFMPPNQRHVGMVFQSYALWPHMNVRENVAFGLRVRRTAGGIDSAVKKALDVVQMSEYADRRPNELSGGQQQRIALARALVVQPRVLLLDEPLSNLDAKLRADLRSEIRRICKDSQTTALYVTHDQKEALAIADRIAVLRGGRICQVGTPHELYNSPTDTFVAGFLGEVNLLPAINVSVAAGEALFRTSFGEVQSCHPSALKSRPGGTVVLGIRPERLQAVPTSGSTITGRVESALFLGESTQLRVRAGSDALRIAAGSRTPFREGDSCGLSVDPSDVMCLPSV
ncbi:MAG: ABC transporter ATP-binding protein [Phycisphaerales bacterium]|nr:ABC transporter ATP-binding protein [Phycisphaerales bacterium]